MLGVYVIMGLNSNHQVTKLTTKIVSYSFMLAPLTWTTPDTL